jgi:glycosyltransferase involved in cell wall biosynthesis
MEKIRFVTLFPDIENVHLVKDVGMIPYSLKKYYDYDSGIVVYKNREYSYFDTDVKSLKKMFFPLKDRKRNKTINGILFLIKNAKKIDFLHLYHPGRKITRVFAYTYLKFNKKGRVYIHLDENGKEKIVDFFGVNGRSIKSRIKCFVLKHFTFKTQNRKRILFGIQNSKGLNQLRGMFPFDNIRFIPNGYEDTTDANNKIKKENIILFVGRAGSKQKRIDVLLDGFLKAKEELKDWKLMIVGPTDGELEGYINEFNKRNKDMSDSIQYTGPIYNRNELKAIYQRAKVFCLTSDYESFGLVLVEALANQCTIVSSNIVSSEEIICKDKYGRLFEKGDSESLAKTLIETCKNEELQRFVQNNSAQYIKEKFSYESALKELDNWIKEEMN